MRGRKLLKRFLLSYRVPLYGIEQMDSQGHEKVAMNAGILPVLMSLQGPLPPGGQRAPPENYGVPARYRTVNWVL